MTDILDKWMEPYLYFFVRICLGLLFFFQAYDKLFRIKLKDIYVEVCQGCRKRNIPDWLSKTSVFGSSYIEFLGGFLLLLGLFQLPLLYLLGIHMILVIAGFSFLKGVWDMHYVFPRFIMLVLLMVMPEEWNKISLDALFFG